MIERLAKEYGDRKVHYMKCKSRAHVSVSSSAIECAIMDMILISESDFLIYTGGSSFGYLISNLMGLVAAPIIPSYFEWHRGL